MIFERSVFVSGKYVQHFTPDDPNNPFHKIYQQKKQDTIALISKSKDTKSILDAGGGMGRLSVSLAKSKENRVVLADISIDMLTLASSYSREMDNLTVVKADFHSLPFNDKSFEYVVGLDILCHLERPEQALNEVYRILKNDGYLILDSTNSNPLWAIFYPRYLGKNPLNWLRVIKYKGVYPGWQSIVKHYSKKNFFSLLNKMGFRIVQCLNYGPMVCPKWHLVVSRKVI